MTVIQPPTDPTDSVFIVRELGERDIRYAVYDARRRRLTHEWRLERRHGESASIDIQESGPWPPGSYELHVHSESDFDEGAAEPRTGTAPAVQPFEVFSRDDDGRGGGRRRRDPLPVALYRSASLPTDDEVLWGWIQRQTGHRRFEDYKHYVDDRVCRSPGGLFAATAYEDVVTTTEEFLARRVPRLDPGDRLSAYLSDRGLLPYLESIVNRFPDLIDGDPCADLDVARLADLPFPVELIWSYWEEEGGLVQTLNQILARFQNRRPARGVDRLARFDLNPLRPLRHLLWSWAEDEVVRLTLRRRAAEYEYEYGLSLVGRAVPHPRLYVERRNRFLDSFHTLLHEAQVFFEADDQTTVVSDGFPVLNALRDTHLVLAEGAHNQFGDLPTQARVQMMIMQWLLAQPEMRDFLGGRPMVPYQEAWMDRVDAMRSIQGWSSASVTHFNELAVYGEQLLLSIRWGSWNSTELEADNGKNWARTWRNAVQRYVHAYRAVTGVDLVAGIDARMPAHLLARRESRERTRA